MAIVYLPKGTVIGVSSCQLEVGDDPTTLKLFDDGGAERHFWMAGTCHRVELGDDGYYISTECPDDPDDDPDIESDRDPIFLERCPVCHELAAVPRTGCRACTQCGGFAARGCFHCDSPLGAGPLAIVDIGGTTDDDGGDYTPDPHGICAECAWHDGHSPSELFVYKEKLAKALADRPGWVSRPCYGPGWHAIMSPERAEAVAKMNAAAPK